MDKEALLNIILSDIGEIETLVKSFKGKPEISTIYIDLTERKLSHLAEEIALLKSFAGTILEQPAPTPIQTETPDPQTEIQNNQVTETPQPNTIKEEINIPPTPPTPPIQEEKKDDKPIETKTPEKVEKETPPISEPIVNIEPEPVIPPKATQASQEVSSKTLGESFSGEKKSVNDRLASNTEHKSKSQIKGKPISDLTKGLGINDRFLFQRELFSGNSNLLQQTLQQLNEMPDFNSAQSFIFSNFNWDHEAESVQTFINYIKRKFN